MNIRRIVKTNVIGRVPSREIEKKSLGKPQTEGGVTRLTHHLLILEDPLSSPPRDKRIRDEARKCYKHLRLYFSLHSRLAMTMPDAKGSLGQGSLLQFQDLYLIQWTTLLSICRLVSLPLHHHVYSPNHNRYTH